VNSAIDHLVVTADSRPAGATYLAGILGVEPLDGGEHPRMGTHNALVRLGESAYVEAIAVNPAVPIPARPRWFGLDRLSEGTRPHLATWVVRTTDIERALAASRLPLGSIETMRRGSFEWRITVPSDGSLPFDGAAPSLIQWETVVHPTDMLPSSGCELLGLRVQHPEAEAIAAMLREIGFDGPVNLVVPLPGQGAGLLATIQTPRGLCEMGV
jgi:hypothetical protein